MYDSISAAMRARLTLQQQESDASARIFRLKRDADDGKIDADAFDDQRIALNDEVRRCAGEIRVLDAWVEERRERNRAERHAKHLEHEAEAQKANAAARAERHARYTQSVEQKLERDRIKAEQVATIAREKTVRDADSCRKERKRLAMALKRLISGILSGDTATPISELRLHFPGLVESCERGGPDASIYPRDEP